MPVIIILVVLIGFVGVYYLGTLKPNKVAESSTPTPVTSVEPTADPTANWKTYTNKEHGVSFKYPLDWKLTETSPGEVHDGQTYNIWLKLNKKNSTIGIGLNINGIGGGPRNVPYDAINLWGKTYYKQYGNIDFSNNTKRIDISENATGLGAFIMNSKTYMISLTYPAITEGEKPNIDLSKEFDQILSTFKFTN